MTTGESKGRFFSHNESNPFESRIGMLYFWDTLADVEHVLPGTLFLYNCVHCLKKCIFGIMHAPSSRLNACIHTWDLLWNFRVSNILKNFYAAVYLSNL